MVSSATGKSRTGHHPGDPRPCSPVASQIHHTLIIIIIDIELLRPRQDEDGLPCAAAAGAAAPWSKLSRSYATSAWNKHGPRPVDLPDNAESMQGLLVQPFPQPGAGPLAEPPVRSGSADAEQPGQQFSTTSSQPPPGTRSPRGQPGHQRVASRAPCGRFTGAGINGSAIAQKSSGAQVRTMSSTIADTKQISGRSYGTVHHRHAFSGRGTFRH